MDVIFVVRSKPVINDVLKEDAYICGINKVAKIISSGSDAPPTILKYCSKDVSCNVGNLVLMKDIKH